jgi:hypothetical protein
MDKNTNEYREEKKKQEQKLEALLLERLEGEAAPLTKADFEEIKKRGLARLKAKKTVKNPPSW